MKLLCRLVLTVFLMFFSVSVYSNDKVAENIANFTKISEISIKGLKNIELKYILSSISLKKGNYYSSDLIKKDIYSILKLGNFDNVESKFDDNTGKLTYVIIEKPYIKSIVFKGNFKFSKRKLKNLSALKEKDYYDISKLEKSKRSIRKLYADNGYVDCKIEIYPTIDSNTNKMVVTFLITENNKIVIGGVDVEGVVYFKKEKILKFIKMKPAKIFKEDIYRNDLKLIKKFYKNNGFIDYKFISLTTLYNESRTKIFLKLNISEGVKYKINSVVFYGNFVIDDKKIKRVIKIKKGQIFNQNKVIETIKNISKIYLDNGYLHSEIIPSFSKTCTKGLVDISLLIKENSIIYVGDIHIDGLISTKEKVIRREILLTSGDVFSVTKLQRSLEQINNLGFIEKVEPHFFQTTDSVDLNFSITEGKAGIFSMGVGYSSIYEFIGSFQLRHMNMFGLAQKLNFSCEFGSKRQNYQINWVYPWVFDKNMDFALGVFDLNKQRDYRQKKEHDYKKKTDLTYDEHKIGGMAKINYRINSYVTLSSMYKYEYVEFLHMKERVKKKLESDEINSSRISSISPGIVYDSRDYIFDPSKGNRQSVDVEFASALLGSNENFIKGNIMSTWYFPTFWKFILKVNFECGVIKTLTGQHRILKSEKFYLGGADSVRGYAYRTEIGPSNGGKAKCLINIEYKFPLIFRENKPVIHGLIFYDIGGVWKDSSDVRLHLGTSSKDLRSGVGFGIKFVTPIFPLRLDWGYGLNHKKGEALQQFYFNIGNTF
ncbi:MAG: outer membrane protein assembly factor BamA [Endomicrobium sp.]|jgi:outer membrane protein insertion porin family|nr:outer membrane protein assembly factor BamA [Endomicrobium sp.]